jgi:hypothetical protein
MFIDGNEIKLSTLQSWAVNRKPVHVVNLIEGELKCIVCAEDKYKRDPRLMSFQDYLKESDPIPMDTATDSVYYLQSRVIRPKFGFCWDCKTLLMYLPPK